MASFSVLTVFWIIKTSQVKEKKQKEKIEERSSFCSRALSLWEALFCSSCKSPFKNPIFGTGLELLTNQVPIVVYCHSSKELKIPNFVLCTIHAKMPCKCEFRTIHATLVQNLLCSADSTWDLFFCIFWCKFLSYPCN